MSSIRVSGPQFDFTPPALIFYLKVGGGFFTGRYNAMNEAVEGGSRFDPNKSKDKWVLCALRT